MKKEDKGISRRSFLKAAPAIGVSAVSTTLFQEADAAPLRVPGAEYSREKTVPVLCQMCAQFCPANAYVKDGKVIRMEASPVHEYKGICGRSRAAAGDGSQPGPRVQGNLRPLPCRGWRALQRRSNHHTPDTDRSARRGEIPPGVLGRSP